MPDKLKDLFFTSQSLNALGESIRSAYPPFDISRFLGLVVDTNWKNLELKAKMRHTTLCLKQVLPQSYAEALHVLTEVAPGIKGFEAMCLPDFVEMYGRDHWDVSLKALRLFTRYSSSEFAIRPFLVQNPERGMNFMVSCAMDPHENVRRFASEGCRPRLPWAINLPVFIRDPSPIRRVLDLLKNDPSEFVRRSVANNLNDISKDHPEIMLEWCTEWIGTSGHTDKIIKHACRTLLKAGHPGALELFGYGDAALIQLTDARVQPDTIKIGESVTFSFKLNIRYSQPAPVRIEYIIQYPTASGRISTKVFKLGESAYTPGIRSFRKKHAFSDMSTRRHYPGPHSIGIQVNGVVKHTFKVELTR